MPYKLSETLKQHTQDVRALSTPTDNLILSASRDSTAISWQRSPSQSKFTPEVVLRAGSRFVNSVAYIPPTADAPKGYAVTGGQDAVINVFNLEAPKDDPDFSLIGHTENICALDITPGGAIISGSWDKTAKVWKGFALVYDLKGHQQSVWAVLGVDEDQFLTGSADKTIKLWQNHKALHTFTGHQDAVRGLALIPDIGFASCSNDSEIRVWTLGGDAVYSLSGHTSFVYSLSVLPNGDIVSAGEDRTVRVWKDGECSQTIVHPAISVWAVSTMPNSDIVSGCSDGVVRVFSASEDRWASVETLKEYDDQVASQALPSQQVGDVKKSDLPGPEALNTPGKKSGEVKMIRNGELVEAHQWDSNNHTWQKIGDVVDAVGQGRKQLYQGKEYDYVFDVDSQDGVPPLKLPYNAAENPYGAAQRFLHTNELPLTYVDEIVKFIEKNTAGVNIGTGGEDFVDPFTGTYRSSAGSNSAQSGPSQYVDPFTGASRYVAAPQGSAPSSGSYGGDPFTGASRYSGAPPAASAPPAAAATILPVPNLVNFKQANVTAMQGKLFQFDEALRHEISTSSLAMYPDEINLLDEAFAYLSQVTVSPARPPSNSLTHVHVEAIIQILERWPSSQRFPVIDLSRLLIGFCPDAFSAPDLRDKFSEALFKASEWSTPWTLPLSKARETNMLLLLRTLANAFQEDGITDAGWLARVLETLGQAPYTALTKTQRVALATVLFNASCEGLRYPLELSLRNQLITLIAQILESETADSEAVYRTLVALGNTVFAAKIHETTVSAPQVGEISQCLQSLPTQFPESRVRNVCVEIGTLL
ncbi:phospholipase A-2-activating protein [Crassisporium funariophilum]|nr:phospholipase A-2-activating protein [Crassisporium funariophilum]